ncbi:uncharacterized protein LOC114520270 [Dendronephthya gigantea]|uniref:uncharacterized protein LOC114520270 n=1 Tax=Dendronephthya gigantea TaxID=151771 RepID=UPI00106AD5CB|nr:uncharacterized protein LOC114520270 [Dendronephthya gigantea]
MNYFVLVPPSYPPREIKLKVGSSTSLEVSWKSPVLGNSLPIFGYQVLIARVPSDEKYNIILRTKSLGCVVCGLKPATRYRVKVSARNKIGYGEYSKDKIVITNAAPAEILPLTISQTNFSVRLKQPRKEIRFIQIVVMTLSAGLPKSHPNNFKSYHDAKTTTEPSYITAEFDVADFKNFREFTVGDGGYSLGVIGMKYFNGPLSPGTMYTIFQKFYNEQLELIYESDYLSPIKTKEKEDYYMLSGSQAETSHSSTAQEEFKLGFIIVIVLFFILLLVLAVVVVYRRRHESNDLTKEKSRERSGSCTIEQTEHESEREKLPTGV